MNITREDFYCGAFLSYLLNNGIVPALFEERIDSNRKIYDFATDDGDFRVYVKFSENPSSESDSKSSQIWNFPFTDKQIEEIKTIEECSRKLYFIFVCGRKALNKSRISVVYKDIIFKCIDLKRIDKYKNQSIKVRLIKGHRDFDIYGTARADKLDGLDNTLKVKVNNIDQLFAKKNSNAVI
ncbi:hypothetical protein [Clostridium guangxiense]|uniref:hypothetical protein n=1 Tax=Clostridium guangxiense TaxID=1662055 RepID=UPI001E5B8EF5|nr:hypothetical protein [Clostridium guangxiense]MCD2348245.1 hypothetical protein [Clostridium guangxiense]